MMKTSTIGHGVYRQWRLWLWLRLWRQRRRLLLLVLSHQLPQPLHLVAQILVFALEHRAPFGFRPVRFSLALAGTPTLLEALGVVNG
jgi:hypothetical protein